MRHMVVGRRVAGAHVDTRQVAVVAHVGEAVLCRIARGLTLDGVAEVRHGRERHRHRRGGQVLGIRLLGSVSLDSTVWREHHLLGRGWVGRVGKHWRCVRSFPLVVVCGREEILVVVVHWWRVLSLHLLLHRRRWSGLLRLWLRLSALRAAAAAALRCWARLLTAGRSSVRAASPPLEVLETLLELLACNETRLVTGPLPTTSRSLVPGSKEATYGSCAGQCGFVSSGARQGRRSLSNPHLGSPSC